LAMVRRRCSSDRRDRNEGPFRSGQALRGRPAAERVRAAKRGSLVNWTSGITEDVLGAPRVRSARVRITRDWLRRIVVCGIGGRPVSSHWWHHATIPTTLASRKPAIHGFESQSAPASSTNISVPLDGENVIHFCLGIAGEATPPSQFSCALEPETVTRITHSVCQPSRCRHRSRVERMI
jgi:hypothetical protein